MGCGYTGKVDEKKPIGKIGKTIYAALVVFTINFFGNGLYNYLYLNAKADSILKELNSSGLYEKLQAASSKLSFLNSLDCQTDKCLEAKIKLSEDIKKYDLEIKTKEAPLLDLSRRSEKSRGRAFIYGYFKK